MKTNQTQATRDITVMTYKDLIAYAKELGIPVKFEPKPKVIELIKAKLGSPDAGQSEPAADAGQPAAESKGKGKGKGKGKVATEEQPAAEASSEDVELPEPEAEDVKPEAEDVKPEGKTSSKGKKPAAPKTEPVVKDPIVSEETGHTGVVLTGKESVKDVIDMYNKANGTSIKLVQMDKSGVKHIATLQVAKKKVKFMTTDVKTYAVDAVLEAKIIEHGDSKAEKIVSEKHRGYDVSTLVGREDVKAILSDDSKTKSDKARNLYFKAKLSIGEAAKLTGIHYSFAYCVIDKFRKEHGDVEGREPKKTKKSKKK